MTTEIAIRETLTPTPQIDKSLSPQELADHRQKIASEVKVVLSAYFQPHESEAIKAAQLAWWCDELQAWTLEQIVWGLRAWNRDNPRLRPTPGDITALLKAIRGRREAARVKAQQPQHNEPPRERPTPERAAEILKEVGLNPRRMPND